MVYIFKMADRGTENHEFPIIESKTDKEACMTHCIL